MSVILFIITYAGIALGKIPGFVVDRVGIALLGAIGMVAFGVVIAFCGRSNRMSLSCIFP
jgi:hypothetical protein